MLANKIKLYRESAGLTRSQLAKAIEVDRTLVWRYEHNKCQPRDEIKIRIAKVLKKTVGEIFFSQPVALQTTNITPERRSR